MIALDMRTLVVVCFITYLVSVLCIGQLWRQNRRQFAGMGLWLLDFACQTLALGLIALRGVIPEWASIVPSNLLVVGGALLIYVGLGRFFDKPLPQAHNYVLLGLFAAGAVYWGHLAPDLGMRNLILSAALLAILGQCLWLLWRGVGPAVRSLSFGVGLVFAGYVLLSLVRIAAGLFGEGSGNDYLKAGTFEVLVLVCYLTLHFLLTYALILMVNKRLIVGIESQREKFARAFQAAPFAIALARAADGRILDVNRTFEEVSGFHRDQLIGRGTLELGLWEQPEDRAGIVAALARGEAVSGREQRFRRRDGTTLTGLFSAQTISVDGEDAVLSCIADISERKAAELALERQSAALRERGAELDRFNRVAVGRELDMIRLKQEINALSRRLGLDAPYPLDYLATRQGAAPGG